MYEVSSDRERKTLRERPSPRYICLASSRTSSVAITARVLTVLLATCALTAFAFAAVAAAAEPNTWDPVTALPTGSTPASDQILSSPTGALFRYSSQEGFLSLAAFEANGTLGPAQIVTGTSSGSVAGPVAFLPDGAAVISFESFSSAPLDLTVRLPNGAYGPRFNGNSDKPIVAFAVREGEVLLAREEFGTANDKPAISVSTLAIGAGGELTEMGTPTPIYELPASDTAVAKIYSMGVAMDASGQADLVAETEGERYGNEPDAHNEILDLSRSAQGSWSGPRVLSAGLFEEKNPNELQVAVAPGGRALLTFQDGKFPPCCNSGGADQLADDVYQSVREPGGTFSTPTQVQSIEGTGGVEFKTQVAAGGDGTLAESVRSLSCQTFEDTSEVPVEAIKLLVAGPGIPLHSYSVSVLDTKAESTTVRIPDPVLGAGDGEALLGVQNRIVTKGHETNTCGAETSEENGRVEDRAVLVGEHEDGEKTFASGEYQLGSELSTANLSVESAGIDTVGNAAVTGSLATSSGAEYDFYTGTGTTSGNEETNGGGSGAGGSGTGSTGSTTAVSTSGTAPSSGANTTTTSGTSTSSGASTTTVTAGGATITVSGSSVTLPGQASCSDTAASPCTITTTATIPASDASAAAAAAHKHKSPTPITIGNGTTTLAAGATGSLHLTLTKQGLAILRSRHTLSITVAVKIAGAGRPSFTRTLQVRLTAKKTARKK
jgi:hypothetical protein